MICVLSKLALRFTMADAAAKDTLAALEFISEDDRNTYEGWLRFRIHLYRKFSTTIRFAPALSTNETSSESLRGDSAMP